MARSSLINKILKEGVINVSEEELEEEIFSLYNLKDRKGLKKLHDVLINSLFLKEGPFRSFLDAYFFVRDDLDLVAYYVDGEYDEELEDNQMGPIQKFYRKTTGYGINYLGFFGELGIFDN